MDQEEKHGDAPRPLLSTNGAAKGGTERSKQEGFLNELWPDVREVLHHAIIFGVLLVILSIFSFIIPQLPIPKANQETLKNFDLALIYILIVIYTLLFLYKTLERIFNSNPGLKSIGKWFLSFKKPKTEEAVDVTTPAVVNRISDVLILGALGVTLFFAIRGGEWIYGFSVPVAFAFKGLLILRHLPAEATYLGWFSLLCLIAGLVIVVTNFYSKKEFPLSWWIPAVSLLGLAAGTVLGVAQMSSKDKPKKKPKTTKQGKKEQ